MYTSKDIFIHPPFFLWISVIALTRNAESYPHLWMNVWITNFLRVLSHFLGIL